MINKMINFDDIEKKISIYRTDFSEGVTEYVVIDDFLSNESIESIYTEFPDPIELKIQKSRDYVFAKNKYEKSELSSFGHNCIAFKEVLLSERFQTILKRITGEDVFLDPNFHGGGLHQGGEGSFLNMHADFNYHPENNKWFRNLNILL
jgi:hypothetical protein